MKNNYNKNLLIMEVKMFKFNNLKKLFLLPFIFAFTISIAKSNNETQINLLILNIENLANNINQTVQEFEKINEIKLKNALIIGIIKNFKGDISFSELTKLNSLEKSTNPNQTPYEILEFTANLIASKTNSSENKKRIEQIKNFVSSNLPNIEKTQTTNNLDQIKNHPTIQKMINIAKSNPIKLKNLLNEIIKKVFPQNYVNQNLQGIVNNLDCLL
ncbi:hypothetical protein GF385_03760 [Candidatus Dependentiae bacterium]|nr:hypothetical protein [Candidatus Dependentiae bacterium]